MILENDHGDPADHSWIVAAEDLDLGNADPDDLAAGGFRAIHPVFTTIAGSPVGVAEHDMAADIDQITGDAWLVGRHMDRAAATLPMRLRAHDRCPSWEGTIDIATLAAGSSYGRGSDPGGPPWSPDTLARAIDVAPMFPASSALDEARWVRGLFNAITRRPS